MKLLHVLDASTDIPVLAMRMDEPLFGPYGDNVVPPEGVPRRALGIIARAGYGGRPDLAHGYVLVVNLLGPTAQTDPFKWGNVTMLAAHRWLIEHFDEIEHGGALDAEPLRLALIGEVPA